MNRWPWQIHWVTDHALYRYLCRVDKVGYIAQQLLRLRGQPETEHNVFAVLEEFDIDTELVRDGMWMDVDAHKREATTGEGGGADFLITGRFARYLVTADGKVTTCVELRPRHLLGRMFGRRAA